MLTVRTGNLLWFGAIVGLWTATSFIETIRDILRRAYGVKFCAPFWEYRLGSMLMILGAVLLLMIAFAVSAALTIAHHVHHRVVSAGAEHRDARLDCTGLCPAVTLFGTFYLLFLALTPSRYRKHGCRKWPGALLITVWWLGDGRDSASGALAVRRLQRTYGSLAGVMIALIFFFMVGLGVVIGAELNAALAESGATALKGEIYTGPYTDELEVEEPQPGEDVEIEAANRGTATLTGVDAGQARADHGPCQRPLAGVGHRARVGEQGAELAFSYQGEALEKRVRPLAAELGSRLPGRLRRVGHEGARPDLRRAERAMGVRSTSSSTPSAIRTRMSCAASSSIRRWTIS